MLFFAELLFNSRNHSLAPCIRPFYIYSYFARLQPFWWNPGTLALSQQIFFTDQKITERSQQVQSIGVLDKAARADLAVTEELFNAPERMLHLGTNTGFDFFGIQLVEIHFLPYAGQFGNEPRDVLCDPYAHPTSESHDNRHDQRLAAHLRATVYPWARCHERWLP